MKKRVNWRVLISSLIVVYLIAIIGGIFTSSNTNSEWYQSIKPSITPPNYIFPIVWNILFFLIGISIYLSWINAKKNQKSKIILVYGINFFLNILWSFLFFYLKNPRAAFFDLVFLEFSILSLIIVSSKINKKTFWILLPYLLWVSFAGVLNWLMIQ